MNTHWSELKMQVQGKIAPPKSNSKDWDDNWEQDERYYMHSQDTGDFNEHAASAISELKDTIALFKVLASKYKVSEKDNKKHQELVKIASDLLEKTRQDNLWNRDCPNDYKKCMNAVLDAWQHEYELRRILKGF
jgi:uncharacterized UPF0160 family protein